MHHIRRANKEILHIFINKKYNPTSSPLHYFVIKGPRNSIFVNNEVSFHKQIATHSLLKENNPKCRRISKDNCDCP